jgi:pyruvate kinase
MTGTDIAPTVPISKFKRTKIIATVGPATNSYDSILAMVKAGVNGFRLNFSHGTNEEREQQIPWIRKASQVCGKPVAIIQDLQGPKIRLGDFEGVVTVQTGQSLSFAYKADYDKTGHLPTQYDLSKKVKRGERLYLFDGRIRTTITSVMNNIVYARAENDGVLIARKGINLPDTDLQGDIITVKDRKDLTFGSTQDIDYVALSFVQSGEDVVRLKNLLRTLGSTAKVIAKIETKAATENLEEIVREADMVMIARGDLAIETMPESVPVMQREVVGLGLKYAVPTIVATQMLASMTDEPEPTRAEVSDIATAVIIGADCVMLSDETATGRYPIEAIKIMKRVILHTQAHNPLHVTFDVVASSEQVDESRHLAISKAVISLAESIDARAIVSETRTGTTARQIAAHRPWRPIIAVTSDVRACQQLALLYGAKSYLRPDDPLAATKLTNWLHQNKVLKKGDVIVTVSGKYPGVVGSTDTIKVRVL